MKYTGSRCIRIIACMLLSLSIMTSCHEKDSVNEFAVDGFAPKNVAGKKLLIGMYTIKFNSNTSAIITAVPDNKTCNVTYSSIEYKRTNSTNAVLTFHNVIVNNEYASQKRIENGEYYLTFLTNNSGYYSEDGDYYFIMYPGSSDEYYSDIYHTKAGSSSTFSLY